MSKKAERNTIVALDIGTSKVVAMVGEVNENSGRLEVIGIGSSPSRGMRRGVVVNIESTIQSIQKAVEEAELMSGIRISSVYVGIAGSHVRSLNSHGIVAIKEKEVTSQDLERVMDAARAVAIPADQRILHVLPQEYVIDTQEGIREPVGMSGVRLEARVHLVTAAHGAAQNIIKCVERCGLSVEDIILEQVASSYAVLEEDEKELGVCLVDIGGGTSDIAVFLNGAIHHTAVIPIAGDQVTNDIALGVRTPTRHAEAIKKNYGVALQKLIEQEEFIDVPGVGEREALSLSNFVLASVIEPRYAEIFELVLDELQRSGYEERIGAGIVLTGGTSKIKGAIELAEEIFHMPVRLGMPRDIGGLRGEVENPIHSTGVGLLLYGIAQQAYGERRGVHPAPVSSSESLWERIKGWFNGNL